MANKEYTKWLVGYVSKGKNWTKLVCFDNLDLTKATWYAETLIKTDKNTYSVGDSIDLRWWGKKGEEHWYIKASN